MSRDCPYCEANEKAWEKENTRADKAEFMRDKYETLAREFTERSIKAESRAARLAAVIPNLLAIIDAEVGECTCEQDWCSRCTEKALAEKGKS